MEQYAYKTCTKCKEQKPATSVYFNKASNTSDKLQYWCKECKHKIYAEYKDKISEARREKRRLKYPIKLLPEGFKRCCKCNEIKAKTEYGKCSKAKDGLRYECNICRSKYYLTNREYLIDKRRKHYADNKERISERNKRYRIKNEEVCRKNNQRYYLNNTESIKKRTKQYHYQRIQEDIGYKIQQRCRTRIYKALKGYVKSQTTIELVGCPIEKLIMHIENQFKRGMTWGNYGTWHLDHIKPCALFDLSKPEQQKECFHYTNLQPLWADENMVKSSKYEEAI